ncbi:5-oxoprolinase subunit PxpB [Halobacillus sp. Marseille-Q1614]|uniref:5-oxoprolinase subunit PxpB n=1 Tax=Halobacillus sp. Marseille-Q1614 TaxID=2709134 RepID=UPI00156E637A|nr:5-oxoprolinase subunit PxpB [Halobacillus sp. Marseille-Q1614]
MDYTITPLGDQAVVVTLSETINDDAQKKVRFLTQTLEESAPEWVVEYIPAFTTVTIFYNPLYFKNSSFPYEQAKAYMEELLSTVTEKETEEPRTIEIPVCYGGDFGPDLEFVAKHNGLSPEEVIDIHQSGEYIVYMIGFAPGFPFIGGMSEKIAAPRRESPRLTIPERSVGIAGNQTGVYPIETPGGWQLIGRTPVKLFTPEEETPSLLKAGDRIRFKVIEQEEYENWEDHQHVKDS